MVAGGASNLGLDHVLLLKLEAEILGRFHRRIFGVFGHITVVVREIVNFFERTKIDLGRTMAIETPTHRVGLRLIDDLHFVDVAMAALAGNPPVDVGGVVEINVVRCLVDAHPLDRLTIVAGVGDVHRLMQRGQFRAIPLHVLVAVPASASCRDV